MWMQNVFCKEIHWVLHIIYNTFYHTKYTSHHIHIPSIGIHMEKPIINPVPFIFFRVVISIVHDSIWYCKERKKEQAQNVWNREEKCYSRNDIDRFDVSQAKSWYLHSRIQNRGCFIIASIDKRKNLLNFSSGKLMGRTQP